MPKVSFEITINIDDESFTHKTSEYDFTSLKMKSPFRPQIKFNSMVNNIESYLHNHLLEERIKKAIDIDRLYTDKLAEEYNSQKS